MKIKFLVATVILFMSGCAWIDRKPLLTYSSFSVPQPQNKIILKVIPFEDKRTIKDTVGYSRNGFGQRCAKVIPQNNVAGWVTNALKLELTNAGYTISEEENTPNKIEGVVIDIFCDTYFTYDGRASLKVSLKKDGKILIDKDYSSTKSGGANWAATSESFAKTLDMTLQDVLKQVMFDINKELLKN